MADQNQTTSTPADEPLTAPRGDEGAAPATAAAATETETVTEPATETESEAAPAPAKKTAPTRRTKAGPKSHAADDSADAEKPAVQKPAAVQKDPHGKKFRALSEKVEPGRLYDIDEAVALAKETSPSKFNAAVELHVRLAQEARGPLQLPHSTGKTVRVAVAGDEVYAALSKNKIDFDVLVAKPSDMVALAKFARLLGPKGLMPNPKSGTITEDTDKVKAELEQGRLEYRTDTGKNVHLVIGRADQSAEELSANARAVLHALVSWGLRGAVVSTTMGPGIKLSLEEVK